MCTSAKCSQACCTFQSTALYRAVAVILTTARTARTRPAGACSSRAGFQLDNGKQLTEA